MKPPDFEHLSSLMFFANSQISFLPLSNSLYINIYISYCINNFRQIDSSVACILQERVLQAKDSQGTSVICCNECVLVSLQPAKGFASSFHVDLSETA